MRIVTTDNVFVGMRVTAGEEFSYPSQAKPGDTGVVESVHPVTQWIRVRWDHSNNTHFYPPSGEWNDGDLLGETEFEKQVRLANE